MEPLKLVSCGLLALAGLSVSFFRPAPNSPGAATTASVASPPSVVAPPLLRAPTLRPWDFPTYRVTATAYSAVPGQTDDEPFVTADNSTIPPDYDSRIHWLALSHDLLRRWGGPFDYGDTVRVSGISAALDGDYVVHDTMNRRHHHCLDVLTHPRERYDVFQPGARLHLLSAN